MVTYADRLKMLSTARVVTCLTFMCTHSTLTAGPQDNRNAFRTLPRVCVCVRACATSMLCIQKQSRKHECIILMRMGIAVAVILQQVCTSMHVAGWAPPERHL